MSDDYQVTVYFKQRISLKNRKLIEDRLEKAYFKDMIDEGHADPLLAYQPDEVFKDYIKEIGYQLSFEWDPKEVIVSFSGWDCCRNAVRQEARKIMREMKK